ncbi:MAG: hypothetical protein JWQ07_2438 [Ramlibacter sp.]|nr:hypothetical protein [Ramlibacter sp.]
MRIAVFLAVLAMLAGCTVVPRDAWTFDPTHPRPLATLPMEEIVMLTDRVAQLQLERNDIRGRIAQEPDIWARQRLYARLHGVGMDLSPLERRLASVASAR